ncbi:SDR family oxidoreductase [Streptomyces sp. CA-210063]|uniref:SDR family NAD(P)-dependent oxidoreductase n=1 Tax=Streptomyces sp. CA-210063 TaxID=2801029 RepID=UPI00214C4F5C|nr:SDR family oxidoreductase [Streptomyces sp. CA-210063]UUU36405.1 SDR family oxidoreductase [Streptomyces sp. CA-210063]
MVYVEESPPLRDGYVPAGWPGMRGKRVVVTGGSRGLGEGIVRLLLAEGARVATCAREGAGLAALGASMTGEERARLFTDELDVTDPGRLEDFVTASAKRFGGVGDTQRPGDTEGAEEARGPDGLDGVVACVGGSRGGTFEQADSADWSVTWELNVGHTARLVRAALPHLRAAGGGSIVLISSISGWKPGPPAQYGAAKSALIHLAASLARELGPDRIRVNAVSPGSMLIPGRRWDRMRHEDPRAYDAFAGAELPTGAPVSPHEVARTVVFLLSDWATGVSGAHLPVDRAQNAPSPYGY